MNNEKELTVLVQSCDKYSDVWPTFFEVFKKQWADCPYPIVLNTETKNYAYPGLNIECLNLYEKMSEEEINQVSWTDRYLETIKYINSKYTLVILEDFFIRKKVETSEIVNLINKIETIRCFGAVYFNFNNKPVFYNKKLDLYQIHNDTNCRINSVCGLWNTDVLRKTIVPGEDPWEYERNSTYRWRNNRTRFFSANPKSSPIKLNFREQITQGKWTYECVSLFERLGIDVDFQRRGFTEYPYHQTDINSLKNNIFNMISNNYVLYSLLSPLRRLFRKIRGGVLVINTNTEIIHNISYWLCMMYSSVNMLQFRLSYNY